MNSYSFCTIFTKLSQQKPQKILNFSKYRQAEQKNKTSNKNDRNKQLSLSLFHTDFLLFHFSERGTDSRLIKRKMTDVKTQKPGGLSAQAPDINEITGQNNCRGETAD